MTTKDAKAELPGRSILYMKLRTPRPARGQMRASKVTRMTPITLVCRDLWYYVTPAGKKAKAAAKAATAAAGDPATAGNAAVAGMLPLLRGVSFYAEAGTVLSVMGGTGAGKTTLMDLVLGYKTQGIAQGEILVNGFPKEQATWARVAGYVEQMDLHTAQLTVEETVQFSGRLRLAEATASDTDVRLAAAVAIATVGLQAQARHVVGATGGPGLSYEQRKRLSIAIELVANPTVLFLVRYLQLFVTLHRRFFSFRPLTSP